MWDFCNITKPKARKNYNCQAYEAICQSGYNNIDFAKEDWKVIQEASKDDFKIIKGQNYLKISGMHDGEFNTFRARLDLDNICEKYDLYCE